MADALAAKEDFESRAAMVGMSVYLLLDLVESIHYKIHKFAQRDK